MIPRMRPSSTRKSMPSSATVVPKTLRRPRASMQGMALGLPFSSLRRPAACGSTHQFLRCDAKPLNGCGDAGPVFGKKLLAFALEQQIVRAGFDEHAETALLLDQFLVDKFLISLQDRERIDPKFGRDIAHRWQRIALF